MTVKYKAMSVKSRINLKASFKNGTVPTQQDFCDLIDSAVNKRDDHFFGLWKPGVKYCYGDVVLHEKSLYMLTLEGDVEDCNETVQQTDTGCEDDTAPQRCICSEKPPGPDNLNWCLLRLDIEDEDWHVVHPPGGGAPELMYAKVAGIKVGIGTQEPQARLDVSDENMQGQILLDPDGEADPSIHINNLSPDDGKTFMKNSVGEAVCWTTDAPIGYVFKTIPQPASVQAQQVAKSARQHEMWLMLVTSRNNRPAVGIGTDQPQGMLDVKAEGRGQVLVQPGDKRDPELILVNLDPACDKNYLALSVGEAYSVLTTDAERGFRFKKGQGYSVFSRSQEADHGETLVSMDGNGNVGIGEEDPVAKLQVTDQRSGDFRLSLNNPNPALTVINLRPNGQANYLALGPDNDQGIFVTDSTDGFVFRKGEKCGNKGAEENVNQGENLVRIDPKVKEGDPKRWDTLRLTPTHDTDGTARSYGQYVMANRNECDETGEIKDVLSVLCEIHPIKFRWNEKTRMGDIGEQIGLRAHEVEEHFPQVVMKGSDGSKAIAYQNLVAVLIQAVNELTQKVEELEYKISGGKAR
jgi:hypothetical protein